MFCIFIIKGRYRWYYRPTLSPIPSAKNQSVKSRSVPCPPVGRRYPCQNECGCQLKSTIISGSSGGALAQETTAVEVKIKIEFGTGPKGLLVMGATCNLTGRSFSFQTPHKRVLHLHSGRHMMQPIHFSIPIVGNKT